MNVRLLSVAIADIFSFHFQVGLETNGAGPANKEVRQPEVD